MGKVLRLQAARVRALLTQVLGDHKFWAQPDNDLGFISRFDLLHRRELEFTVENPGWIVNELGQLKSTIKRLSEDEIIERLATKATYEIQQMEDERCFRSLRLAACKLRAV